MKFTLTELQEIFNALGTRMDEHDADLSDLSNRVAAEVDRRIERLYHILDETPYKSYAEYAEAIEEVDEYLTNFFHSAQDRQVVEIIRAELVLRGDEMTHSGR